LGPTERANFKHWRTHASVTTFTYAPEIRFRQCVTNGKYKIKIAEGLQRPETKIAKKWKINTVSQNNNKFKNISRDEKLKFSCFYNTYQPLSIFPTSCQPH
jgi:antitoxin component YwqK of YwqJK toxin-antitoxin module